MSYLNNSQTTALTKSIQNDSISHAYIVSGGNTDDRREYVNGIVKAIFCDNKNQAPCNNCISCRKIDNGNMEDLIIVNKDKNSIKVEQIKELIISLSNKPFSKRTVVIINDSDTMTPAAQNKLLKSLEEPAAGSVLILSTANIFSLLPTIRSRCISVNMGSQEISFDPELDEIATDVVKYSMVNKPLYMIFDLVKKGVDSSEEAEMFLYAMEAFVRDLIVGSYSERLLFSEGHKAIVDRINWEKGYPFEKYLDYIREAQKNIRQGINWKSSIKQMIINIKQEEVSG